MKSGQYINMKVSTFYKTFIISLLKGTVTCYTAFYNDTVLRQFNYYGSKYEEPIFELTITALSNYIYKIYVFRDKRTKEERLEVDKYDFE